MYILQRVFTCIISLVNQYTKRSEMFRDFLMSDLSQNKEICSAFSSLPCQKLLLC